MAKKGYRPEKQRQEQLEDDGWATLRVSGSIGSMDVIAVQPKKYVDGVFDEMLFQLRYEQVKSCKGKTFYFNERSKSELRRLKQINQRLSIPCYFSIKFKWRGWRIIEVDELDGSPVKFQKTEVEQTIN